MDISNKSIKFKQIITNRSVPKQNILNKNLTLESQSNMQTGSKNAAASIYYAYALSSATNLPTINENLDHIGVNNTIICEDDQINQISPLINYHLSKKSYHNINVNNATPSNALQTPGSFNSY